jgi:hypothetical protein
MSNTITFPFLALENTIFLFFSFSIATYEKVERPAPVGGALVHEEGWLGTLK